MNAHDDDFTLEKLKVNERLHNVEIQIARLVAHMESEQGTFARIHTQMNEMISRVMIIIDRHEKLFFGNGSDGLLMDLDRLKQSADARKWHIRLLWGSVIGIAAKFIHDLIDFIYRR